MPSKFKSRKQAMASSADPVQQQDALHGLDLVPESNEKQEGSTFNSGNLDLGEATALGTVPQPQTSLGAGRSQELDLLGVPSGALEASEKFQSPACLGNAHSAHFVEESLEEEQKWQGAPAAVPASPMSSRAEMGGAPSSSSKAAVELHGTDKNPGKSAESAAVAALDCCFSLASGSVISSAYESGPVKVWVKEPEKVHSVNALGMATSHYTFLVRTDSTLEGMLAEGMEVRRRFSEFDALHKLLHTHYKGCFIPPLPEKSHRLEGRLGVGSSHEDFMRLRRADLQAFLRSLTTHPVLVHSEALKLFLLQMGELTYNPAWISLLQPSAATKLTKGPDGGGDAPDSAAAPIAPTKPSAVGSLVSWVRSSIASVAAPPVPVVELPPEEVFLVQAKEMLTDLEKLLFLACESARVMCQDMDRMCEDFREFGRSMGMLARYEQAVESHAGAGSTEGDSAGRRCYDLQRVAICSAKQHNIWRTNSVRTAANLVFLRDFHLLVPEAIKAMDHREAALKHLQQMEAELVRARQNLDPSHVASSQAAAQSDTAARGAERFSFTPTQSISNLEEQVKEAKASYSLIKERNQAELTRFGLERESRFRSMLALFATTQAAMVQAAADAWTALAQQYNVEVGETLV